MNVFDCYFTHIITCGLLYFLQFSTGGYNNGYGNIGYGNPYGGYGNNGGYGKSLLAMPSLNVLIVSDINVRRKKKLNTL